MSCGLLAAAFASGGSIARAQYQAVNGYPSGDPYSAANAYSGYAPASQPAYPGSNGYPAAASPFPTGAAPVRTSPASSNVQQSDEQLLAIARVFEQQGRNAQAQRIYAELARRSAAGQSPAQSVQPSPAGMGYAASAGPYAAMPARSGYAPQAFTNSGAWPTSPSYQPAYQPAYEMSAQGTPQMMAPQMMPPQTMAVPPSAAAMAVGVQPMAPQQVSNLGQTYSSYYGTQAAALNSPSLTTTAAPGTAATGTAESAPVTATSTTSSTTSSSTWPVTHRAASQASRSSGTTAPAQSEGWRTAVTPLPEALGPATPTPAIARQQPAFSGMVPTSTPATAPTVSEPMTVNMAKGEPTPLATSPPPEGLDRDNVPRPLPVTLPATSPPEVTQLRPQPPAPPIELPARSSAAQVPQELPPANLDLLPPERPLRLSSPRASSLQAEGEEPVPAPLRPEREKRLKDFEALNQEADQLAKETDAIRIIPGQRAPGRQAATPLSDSSAADRPSDAPLTDVTRSRWKQRSLNGADAGESRLPDGGIVPRSNTRASNDSIESEVDRSQPGAMRGRVGEPTDLRGTAAAPPSANPTNSPQAPALGNTFDLAALMRSAEFREIHSPAVLDGLELLSERDPRHRALGASRIAMAGRDARTALPVLRQVLATESDLLVRLRIAEALLKAQPNDRSAIDCLASVLSDRNDWQLRQCAACALSGAADGHNPIAVLRLTEALDDSNPRVRTMAALTLAQFHTAAADAIPRLELAVANDVPRVQQAAGVALASIKGIAAPPAETAAHQAAVPQSVPSDSDTIVKRPLPKFAATPPEPPSPAPIVLSEGAGRSKVEDFSPVDTVPTLLAGTEKSKETNSTSNQPGPPPGIWTDAPSSHADPPGAPKALPVVPARPVRPLRIEPAEHHHVPGKPSQPTPPATFQLGTEAGSGKASVKP